MARDISKLLSEGITENFLMEYKQYPKMYPKMFHMRNTKTRVVTVQGWIGPRKPTRRDPGDVVRNDTFSPNFGKNYIVAGFSQGDVVAQEDIDDDQYGMVIKWAAGRGGQAAIAYLTLEEAFAADIFGLLGFTSTSPAPDSPDGKPLFSTSHPMSANDTVTTWSNRPSSDVDLSMAALQAMRANLNQQFAPNGQTIRMNRLARIMVNPNIEEIAIQLQRGTMTPGTVDNNINTMKGSFDVVVNPYFRKTGSGAAATNANAWNAFVGQGEEHFMEWWDRQQVTFDNDKDVNTNSVIFTSHRRFTAGFSDARGMYGSTGA